MVYLSKRFKEKKWASLKDVSEKETIPFDFLEKIFSDLEKTGLVKAKKGIGGGYSLAKNPSKITIKDIVSPLENTTPVNCRLCGKSKRCASKNVWGKVDTAIEKTLKSIKLSDLIK